MGVAPRNVKPVVFLSTVPITAVIVTTEQIFYLPVSPAPYRKELQVEVSLFFVLQTVKA